MSNDVVGQNSNLGISVSSSPARRAAEEIFSTWHIAAYKADLEQVIAAQGEDGIDEFCRSFHMEHCAEAMKTIVRKHLSPNNDIESFRSAVVARLREVAAKYEDEGAANEDYERGASLGFAAEAIHALADEVSAMETKADQGEPKPKAPSYSQIVIDKDKTLEADQPHEVNASNGVDVVVSGSLLVIRSPHFQQDAKVAVLTHPQAHTIIRALIAVHGSPTTQAASGFPSQDAPDLSQASEPGSSSESSSLTPETSDQQTFTWLEYKAMARHAALYAVLGGLTDAAVDDLAGELQRFIPELITARLPAPPVTGDKDT